MSSKSLAYLVSRRKYLRGSVTRMFNERGNIPSKPLADRLYLKGKLDSLLVEITELDEKVLSIKHGEIVDDSSELEVDMTEVEGYRDRILATLAVIESCSVVNTTADGRDSTARSVLKSPTAPLPSFSSEEGESLDIFLENFDAVLIKYNYADYDKFLLLKQQVSGRGSYLLDSLEPQKQTYREARSLLMSAFASKDLQKFKVIKQLSKLKLTHSSEPFQYISETRKIMHSFSELKITNDDIIQYFVLSGLNESFKDHLIAITNKIRPSLKEIVDNFFSANERYSASLKALKPNKSCSDNRDNITSLAVSTEPVKNNPFASCSLCPDNSDHGINKCINFEKSDDKIKRLNSLRGCTKCANLSHRTESCRFRFKKSCVHCSEWHFSFLCPKNESKVGNEYRVDNSKKSAKKFSHDKIQNNLAIVTRAFQGSSHVDSILSTFSCFLTDGTHWRGLRDSGSQSNLISADSLRGRSFVVLNNNVDLTVKGINGPKIYKSKHVKISIQLGSETVDIEALTLPSIDINLNLKGLPEIVHTFSNCNYNMADKHLYDNNGIVNNIDLVLGANSSYLFDEKRVLFGAENKSLFYDTQIGVMLLGSVAQYVSDLSYLPMASTSMNSLSLFSQCTSNFVTDFHVKSSLDETSFINDYKDDLISVASSDLDQYCDKYLNREIKIRDTDPNESDSVAVKFLLNNIKLNDNGRLIIPLLWNSKYQHMLSDNYNLSKKMLLSSRKKLLKNETNLLLMNDVVRELENLEVIEKINNIEQFRAENPYSSFLAHMPIIKPNKETTKCRMVFLSNLCEKFNDERNISHNQAMLSGPCLNQKLSVALLLLRFDEKLLCFDLKKAFLQIELPEIDQNRLCFLWFKDAANGDFSIQAYKNIRLSFGLRCIVQQSS